MVYRVKVEEEGEQPEVVVEQEEVQEEVEEEVEGEVLLPKIAKLLKIKKGGLRRRWILAMMNKKFLSSLSLKNFPPNRAKPSLPLKKEQWGPARKLRTSPSMKL